jgi:O-antigen ligase
VPRLGFDEYLVMGVVLALFFEETDDSLWLNHGFPIPNPTFVLVGAVVLCRAAFLALRGRFDLSKPNWREWTVVGLFAVYAVTALAAALLGHSHQPKGQPLVLVSHLGQSIKTFAHFAYMALIALVLGRLLTPALLRRALATFFVLVVAAAVIACLETLDLNVLHTGATSALHLGARTTGAQFIRPCSIFSEPAVLGYYMLIGIIAGIWLNAVSASRWIWLGICVCVVAALLAAAAGPAVAFFACFAYLLWRAWRVLLRSWRELAMVAVVATAVLVFFPVGQSLSSRATSSVQGSDNSAKFRLKFDRASVTIWRLSPLTGVGLGNDRYYDPALVHFGSGFGPNNQTEFQSVNSYLGALSESGVFGLLLLTAMLLAQFVPFRRVRAEGAWVTEAPLLLFIVGFFFLNLLAFPIFWVFSGMRLAQLRQLEGLGERAQQEIDQPEADDSISGPPRQPLGLAR